MSCKECTWFVPNSANYRESHPEYHASSSKHNSRFPQSQPPGTNFCTTFHAEQECLQECQSTLKMVQKETLDSWKRTGLSLSQHQALHLSMNALLHLPNSWESKTPLYSQTTRLKLQPALCLSFLCFISPVIYYHLTYHTSYLFVFFTPLEGTLPSRQHFLTILSLLLSQRLEHSLAHRRSSNVCWMNAEILLLILKCILPNIRIPPTVGNYLAWFQKLQTPTDKAEWETLEP